MESIIPIEHIQSRILVLRGKKVILDSDLAEMYGVTTKRLNEQVKRNQSRFPSDFMFQSDNKEFTNLKSQFATSRWGGRRKLPNVFTEHGAIMASSVINTETAIKVGLLVVRVFVKMREFIMENKELALQLREIGKRLDDHDESIYTLVNTIRDLMAPKPSGSKIGFNLKS